MSAVRCVHDCKNIHGEGPVWSVDEQKVYWVDIAAKELWAYDPISEETQTWQTPERLTAFAPRQRGGLVAAFEWGLAFYTPETGEIERIKDIESDLPTTRMNDGRCDRQGRFIVGGMDEADGAYISNVYRLDPDLSVHHLIANVSCANSTCFSPDGSIMYFADTPTNEIWAYDYDTSTGNISNKRLFASFENEPGIPDGSIVDAEGGLWNAEWNGHRVIRFLPDGTVDRVIEMPVLNPTCVVFGGKKLDTLFITTSRLMMTPEQVEAEPLSGGLFAVKLDVHGLEEPKFAG